MLLLLLELFSSFFSFKIPTVFSYVSTRMLLATLTTLLLTIFLGPWMIRRLYFFNTGQSIRVEACQLLAERHEHKKTIPTMGGSLILCSMVIALLLWMDWRSSFTLILLCGTIWLGLLGGVDDYLKMKRKNSLGLRSKKKLILQVLFSSLFALYLFYPAFTEGIHRGKWFTPPAPQKVVLKEPTPPLSDTKTQEGYGRYYFPFKKGPLFTLSGWGLIGAFFLTIFVITGASNAVNLTDGLDGLAAGLVLLVAFVLAIFAFLSNHSGMAHYLNIPYIKGSAEVAVYLCAMGGACLGFLWYNGYPAQVFMGDTGSLALGGILGISAIFLRREFLLALVGGVFVIEALSVILQVVSYRYRNKKRIFRCAPLHHHFEFKGWAEPKVVIRFWVVGLVLALIGLVSLKFQ